MWRCTGAVGCKSRNAHDDARTLTSARESCTQQYNQRHHYTKCIAPRRSTRQSSRRCYSIPASHKRFHLTSHLGFSSSQHYSSTPAAYSRAAGTTSPSRRPNSAVYRRTEISLSPRRQTVGSTPTMTSGDTATTTGVVPPPRSQRESEKRRCVGDPTAATATATAAGGVAIVAAADEGTECRREYPGSAQYNKGRTVRVGTGQPRIRPRSAVARVETTVHHQAEVRTRTL